MNFLTNKHGMTPETISTEPLLSVEKLKQIAYLINFKFMLNTKKWLKIGHKIALQNYLQKQIQLKQSR